MDKQNILHCLRIFGNPVQSYYVSMQQWNLVKYMYAESLILHVFWFIYPYILIQDKKISRKLN